MKKAIFSIAFQRWKMDLEVYGLMKSNIENRSRISSLLSYINWIKVTDVYCRGGKVEQFSRVPVVVAPDESTSRISDQRNILY
jgi:hypothetical protein